MGEERRVERVEWMMSNEGCFEREVDSSLVEDDRIVERRVGGKRVRDGMRERRDKK